MSLPKQSSTENLEKLPPVLLCAWHSGIIFLVWSMVTAKVVQQDLTCFRCPRLFLAVSAYFPHQTAVVPFQVYWTSGPCNSLNLSPPFSLFFFSYPSIPSKRVFLPSSQKIHIPMLSHYSLQQRAKYTVIFPLALCPEKDKVVCACSYLLHAPWNEKCYSVSAQKDPSDFWALRPQSREANISKRTASDSNILAV